MPTKTSDRISRALMLHRLFTRLHVLSGHIHRILRMDLWFPHVPLALAVGLAGLLQILPYVGDIRSIVTLPAKEVSALSGGFDLLAIRGMPQTLIGTLLLLMSLGLLRRSHLAWLITMLMTLAALSLELAALTHTQTFSLIYSGALFLLLLLSRRRFQNSSLAAGTLLAVFGILLTLGFGTLGSFVLGAGFSPPIMDFVTGLYFAVTTMSTVGYGDYTPQTAEARLFTITLIALGLLVFAAALTAILGPLMNQHLITFLQPKRKPMKRKDHIIVVGDNPLARNAIGSLTSRGLKVTAVWPVRPPEGAELPKDLVIGDGGDADVLRSAGLSSARAVLALTDNDSENAFVVLAAKELSENIRTLVAVSDAHNLVRVRRVHPDAVLALPVLGGELLAMALNGEEIKTDSFIDQLLKLG